MKNIEKALRGYLNGSCTKLKYEAYISETKSRGGEACNVLFSIINDEIDSMNDTKCLDRAVEVMKYLGVTIKNCENINRKIVLRKLCKLSHKVSTTLIERGNKLDRKHLESELNKIDKEIDLILELVAEKESNKFEFLSFLIDDVRNNEYLDCTINKMPGIVNSRDKKNTHFFRKLLQKFLHKVESFDENEVVYYYNLLCFISNSSKFSISDKEIEECYKDIQKCSNKLCKNKKEVKKNKKGLEYINKVINLIKNFDNKIECIDELADKYNIKMYFDDDVIEHAKLVKKPIYENISDREYVFDYTVTIDSENALEIDDALSCKKLPNGNYLLGVHIASILGYFDYDSEIVQEALKRLHTIYLPRRFKDKDGNLTKVLPMFPKEFSTDIGSLLEGNERLTRSYYFEIDKNGDVVRQDFIKSITTTNKNLTYKEADSILENGCDDSELSETLNNLGAVSSLLDKKNKGAVLYEKIKENISDSSDLRVSSHGSQKIVQQSMMLTGKNVAEFFASRNYPCLYRVHEIDDSIDEQLLSMVTSLTKTYGGNEFKNLYKLLEGIYPKGWYDLEGRHDGLGLEHNCHCTSGLRRAADIVVEHALEVCYDKEPTKEELDKLRNEIIEFIDIYNLHQGPIDWFVDDYKRAYCKRR